MRISGGTRHSRGRDGTGFSLSGPAAHNRSTQPLWCGDREHNEVEVKIKQIVCILELGYIWTFPLRIDFLSLKVNKQKFQKRI